MFPKENLCMHHDNTRRRKKEKGAAGLVKKLIT